MDDHQRNSFVASWPSYYSQAKNMEELTQSLLLTTTLELETTRIRAQEELKIKDEQLNHLKNLLHKAISERDEAHNKCQSLLLEKFLLQQQNQNQNQVAPPHSSGISSIEEDQLPNNNNNNSISSSDCEETQESIVSSPVIVSSEQVIPVVVNEKALPEKGKFLEAVMKAGPLLQNLLLAGPLPQWRHPPPPLETYQIPPPPVLIPSPSTLLRKRGFCEGSDSSTETTPTTTKFQRSVSNGSLGIL